MKRIVLLIGLLAAFNCLCLASGETSAAESAATCMEAVPALPYSQEADTLPLVLPAVLAVPVSAGIPECPETQTCNGGSNTCDEANFPCQANGDITLTDTGSSECTRNGRTLVCLFGTIHIKEQICGHCPCCSWQPFACFCPSDPALCGKAITTVCK